MVQVPSTMLPLGTPVPAFSLRNAVDDRVVSEREASGPEGLLVMFICNHCPFVKHVLPELGRVGRDARSRKIGVVAINANDEEKYPQDAPAEMKALAIREGWQFPFLFDDTQAVARAFRAACTPDFYLFDKTGKLVYRGQLDDSRPGGGVPVTGQDLRQAIDAMLSGKPVSPEQRPSIGCNIKWKKGREPEYYRG